MGSIAIIGISCLFPGSQTPGQFYRSLLNHDTFLENDFLYSVDPDQFDVPVDRKHLEQLDEINTYTLYVVHEALKDSRYLKSKAVLEKTGLIIGSRETVNHKTFELFKPLYLNELEKNIRQLLRNSNFHFNYSFQTPQASPLNVFHFSYPTLFAAQTLALGGPAFAIDAACASSLYAIKLASLYLLSGQIDVMVAGGMFFGKRNKALPYFLDQLGVTPKGGDSRPFDKNSGGMIANEGGGAVVLKRLSDAVQDGDTIYAVIESIGWSNDGAGKYILAPSRNGQARAYHDAYQGNLSKAIDYIECHATGTQTGDLVELNSLEDFYGQNQPIPLLGALKGNIGHLLTASGMAGLIKIIWSMKHDTIPATVNVVSPLSSVKGLFSGATMVLENRTWPKNGVAKRAAINAFGFGGINGHMVIREYMPPDRVDTEETLKADHHPLKLSITGIGIHYGDIQTKKQVSDALFFNRHPTAQEKSKRLRGLDTNKTILNEFLPDQNFPGGYYFSEFDFDYLKNKVHNQEETEAFTKELIMLKVADEALEDAGFKKGAPQNVAVIISTKQSLFQLHFYLNAYLPDFIEDALNQSGISLDQSQIKQLIAISRNAIIKANAGFDFIATGIGPIIATRIASTWNFYGPVFKCCDFENSFMRSVELARMVLKDNAVDAVLLGAIDGDPLLESLVWHSKYGQNYGLKISAMKFAEGAAAIVLKNQNRIAEHDPGIYADIESISLLRASSAVRSAPSFPEPDAFVESYRKALKQAKITPSQIGYMELPGHALNPILEDHLKHMDGYLGTALHQTVQCGSVAFNFGYSFMTSQAISLIKAALMLNYGFLPALPKSSASLIEKQSYDCLKFQDECSYWIDAGKNKKVCVSGLGFDGTSSHIILSGSDRETEQNNGICPDRHWLVIAGQDQPHLKTELYALKEGLPKERSLSSLAQTIYQAYQRQAPHEKKYSIVLKGKTQQEFLTEIDTALNKIDSVFKNKSEWWGVHGSHFTTNPQGAAGKVAVVYPPTGFNSPFALYELMSTFTQLVAYLHRLLKTTHPKTLEHLRRLSVDLKSKDHLPLFMDGILGNLLTYLLLEGLRISPDVFMGCSFGELVMYSSSGILIEGERSDFISDLVAPLVAKLSDAAYIRNYFNDEKVNWVTYFCKGHPEATSNLVQEISQSKTVFMTIKGSPKHVVISGCKEDCETLIKRSDCFAYQISRDVFVHTPLAMTFYDDIVRGNIEHPFRIRQAHDKTYYRTYNRSPFHFQKEEFAYAMADCICRPIDFEAIILKAYEDGVRTFIGMDTSSILTNWINDTLKDKDALILSVKQDHQNYRDSLEICYTQLIAHGLVEKMSRFSDRPMEKRRTQSLIKTLSNAPETIAEAMLKEENLDIFKPNEKVVTRPEPVHHDKFAFTPEGPDEKSQNPIPGDTLTGSGVVRHSPIKRDYLQKMFDQNQLAHRAFFEVQDDLMQILERSIQGSISSSDRPRPTVTAFKKARPLSRPTKRVIWNEEDVKEMTMGRLSKVLGPKYAEADTYPTRARMPLPPFMFVSRVTELDAEFGQLRPSMIEIEYDIPEDAWYGSNGRIPFSIINESSHCGILLLSYMGIDSIFKGRLHYRAIDSSVKIHSEKMLRPGETVKGRFQIQSFIKSKKLMLTIFTYDLFDADHMQIFSIKGTGGFFSKEDLIKAKGTTRPATHHQNRTKEIFTPMLDCKKTVFLPEDIIQLQNGRADQCFGRGYPVYDRDEQLYPKQFKILTGVPHLDACGGGFGLGYIVGEAGIDPKHWIFDVHFKDDPVLPATFIMEGGIQLLAFYVHFLGLKKMAGPDKDYNTVIDSESQSKFRGEVKREKTTLRYEMTIKHISANPEVLIVADVDVFNQDRLIAQTLNMSMKLK